MNEEEINSLIEQLKAHGCDEEDIMKIFYETFEKGKMDRKDLETLANAMGYELTDDFKNDPTPDPISSEGADGMSKEDLENARTLDESGEGADEFKEDMADKAENSDLGDAGDDTDDSEGADDAEDDGSDADTDASDDEGDDEGSDDAADDDADEGRDGEDDDADWKKAQKMFKV